MVAYKSDPLGLSDTVTPSSASSKRLRDILKNKASKLSVRKKKASTAGHSSSAAASLSSDGFDGQPTPVVHREEDLASKIAAKPMVDKTSCPQTCPCLHDDDKAVAEEESKMEDNDDNSCQAPNANVPPTTQTAHVPEQKQRSKVMNRLTQCCGGTRNGTTVNETLLTTAFVSFFLFTTTQFVASFVARSKAMIGDTSAMFIDCLTYLSNYIAERRKHQFDSTWVDPPHVDAARAEQLRERARRKLILTWELIPPGISVFCLVGLTAYILQDSVRILVADFTNRPRYLQEEPNLKLMLSFALCNLMIDFLNVTCFAKAHHLCGYRTRSTRKKEVEPQQQQVDDHTTGPATVVVVVAEDGCCQHDHDMEGGHNHNNGDAICDDDDDDESANLNMCSAYTHVVADTLRSIAVITAAVLALLIEHLTAEVADSTAALVVSVLIMFTVVPLVRGLWTAFVEYREIRAEELLEQQQEKQLQQLVTSPSKMRMTTTTTTTS